MKKLITTIVVAIIMVSLTNAQIKKPVISQNQQGATNQTAVQGIQLPNLERVTSAEIRKLRLPTVSISEAQKNAKPLSTWKITPLQPKYSSLSVDSYYGEYFLYGWHLLPKPLFEGPDFSDFALSALSLDFRVTRGVRYLVIIKLKPATNDWYAGKSILAAAMNNSYAKYPIDAVNNEIMIPFTANASGNRKISIGNIITRDHSLYGYTIENVTINKISK
jgi:hypothetical protein